MVKDDRKRKEGEEGLKEEEEILENVTTECLAVSKDEILQSDTIYEIEGCHAKRSVSENKSKITK